MSGYRAVQLFNLAVPCNGEPTPAILNVGFPATFRITMAAIDPTAEGESDGMANGTPKFIGSTLRMIRVPEDSDDESDNDSETDFDDMDMANLLDGDDSEESDSDDGDPGPSDPSKSPKAKRAAALKELLANGVSSDDEMDIDKPLTAKDKGKGKITDLVDLDSEDDSEDLNSAAGVEEFVLCTLDPSKSYQQPLDFTVNEHEMVYFSSTGTHDIYLTGNILIPEDGHGHNEDMFDSSDEEDDEDYDLEPDEDELEDFEEDDESDELDNVRITEVDSEEEESAPPQLIKAEPAAKKGKNKRSHEDSEIETPEKPTIDSTLKKSLKPAEASAGIDETKLSKSQLKKLRKKMKDNAGNAVEPIIDAEEDKGVKQEKETTPNKKVQFAKTLVQGPTGAAQTNGDAPNVKAEKKAEKKSETKAAKAAEPAPKANGVSKGERVVHGVTIDDRKTGSGPAAKKGDKVSMRYIGKLESDKKIFDANKKGPPFTFKLGAGDVIKGWDIGVLGITVGGERRITVPAHLAYGSKSLPGIPANSTLVFDVKCLEIK